MDPSTIQQLNDINRRFYETIAPDFDQTRGTPWPGWDQLLGYLQTDALPDPLRVLDIGCGNGRFGLFLADKIDQPINYTGLDNNAPLLQIAHDTLNENPHITPMLLEADVVLKPPQTAAYDLVVAFGLLHHIPGAANRLQFMHWLAEQVAPGGWLAFACWCFYEQDRFKQRITPWSPELEPHIEPHDYLLDWRRGQVALRYCHYVDEAEHAQLIAATRLETVTTFRDDGAERSLNRYSLLWKT